MAKGSISKLPPPESDSESDYSSSSDDVEEDEFGEELTPALDAAILKTLGRIKRKEGVYSGEDVLQEALKEAERKAGSLGVKTLKKAVEDKPYLLADYHRSALLSGLKDEDEDAGEEEPLTNVQEQRKLREGAINAFKSLADESEGEDGDEFLLKEREKEDGDMDEEDEEYRKFLLDMGGGEEEVRKILGMGDASAWKADESVGDNVASSTVKKEKKKSKKTALSAVEKEELELEKREKKDMDDDDFLMNYILNRGWIDRSEKKVPTYEEVVDSIKEVNEEGDDEDEATGEPSQHPWGALDEDEFDEQADEFENSYNFRYEEPGSSAILSHPRDIPSLVRRPDDTRKTKRQAREERKAAEKAAKEEETRRLKGQKRREMEAQLNALKKELGDGPGRDWAAVEKIMEGDFDEDEWERVIGGMLAGGDEDDEMRPDFGDDVDDAEYDEEDDGEGYDQYAYGGHDIPEEADMEEEYVDDGPINMDADFVDEEPKRSKKDKKGKKGKERAVEVEDRLTPAERAEKVKQTMEEYKALDHEDMIGDLPTRFKYTQSAPVNFGLSPVEILLATDEELNALAGVRHIAPYRRGGLGKTGMGLHKRVKDLKSRLRARRWGEEPAAKPRRGDGGTGSNDSGMGKKRKWGEDASREGKAAEGGDTAIKGGGQSGPKKRLGKKQRMKLKLAEDAKQQQGEDQDASVQSSQIQAENGTINQDGDGERKKRRKKKAGKIDGHE